jgi:hypothetical protein
MRITQMTAQEVRIRAEHARDSLLTVQARFEQGGPMASNNTTVSMPWTPVLQRPTLSAARNWATAQAGKTTGRLLAS